MNSAVIPISNWQLALSVILLALAGGVSAALRLGLLRSLIWGAVRTFLQLTVMGYALNYVFAWNNPFLVLVFVVMMTFVAARTATKRSGSAVHFPRHIAFIALFCSSILVGFVVVALIIAPKPWYTARVSIPIFGMVLGNSMNGVALCLERMYATARNRYAEIEELLAYGATPWEAIRSCVREAVSAGMMPTINGLMVVGIVSLPGMMTGQILSGTDPRQAVRYQIVVMLMVAAAAATGCLLLVGLSYRRLFTADDALDPDVYQGES